MPLAVVRRISTASLVIWSLLLGWLSPTPSAFPCTYFRLSEDENLWKYEDYVLGVGRQQLDITRSREEAVRMISWTAEGAGTDRAGHSDFRNRVTSDPTRFQSKGERSGRGALQLSRAARKVSRPSAEMSPSNR